jgi:hypothetical protein
MVIEATIIIAVIVGLCQIAKELGVPSKFIPLLAVVLGVLVPFVPSQFFEYIIYGLSATGLFRVGKTMVEANTNKVTADDDKITVNTSSPATKVDADADSISVETTPQPAPEAP